MKNAVQKRRSVMILALLIVMVTATSTANAAGADWPSWRGDEAQGATATAGPTSWSAEENVLWKSDIKGHGHSSPVISGDKLYVTTAYPTERGPELRPLFIKATNIVGLIVGIATLIHAVKLIGAGQTIMGLGLAMFAGLFAKEFTSAVRYAFGTHREAYYLSWLDSHLVLGLACLIALHLVTRSFRMGLGVALLAFAGTLALLRPDPEYYGFLSGAQHLRSTSSLILATLTIAGVVALLVSLRKPNRSIAADNSDASQDAHQEAQGGNPVLWAAVAFVLGLVSLGVPTFLQQLNQWQPGLGLPWLALSQIGGRTCAIALAALLWCIFGSFRVPDRNHLGVAAGVLVVAALTFWTTNFLRSEDTHGRAIVCLDANTGKQLWTCESLYASIPSTHQANSPATPTPVVDNDRVFAYFGSAGMMASDLKGELLWTNSELPFEGIHGVAASPIARDGVVYLTSANSKAPFIVALDGTTGKRIWLAELEGWDGVHGEHRTPVIATVGSESTILNWSMKSTVLTGIDIEDGCQSYRHETGIENTAEAVASLIIDDDVLYLPSKSVMAAVRLPKAGEELEFLWETNLKSKGPNTASPVLHNGLMFFASDHGIASCLDATTGKIHWQKRLPTGSYYSSPIAMGDHIYFANDRGTTTVVASDTKFRKVSENELPDGIYASSAPHKGRLIIRSESAIWCIGGAELENVNANAPSEATH